MRCLLYAQDKFGNQPDGRVFSNGGSKMLSTTIPRAEQLFEQSVSPNIWQQLRQMFRRSRNELLTLPQKKSSFADNNQESQVALEKIIGSFNAGRARDFDGAFRPRQGFASGSAVPAAGRGECSMAERIRGGCRPPYARDRAVEFAP